VTIHPPQPPPGGEQPEGSGLAGAAETIAWLTSAALEGGLRRGSALASLSTVRRLAAELERCELALIETARDDRATWSEISAALGTCHRQTAQKRHADFVRRRPRLFPVKSTC
jgi:hypothetical protein